MFKEDVVGNGLVKQWHTYLTAQQDRLESYMASETDDAMKAEYQKQFAENKKHLAELDEMKNQKSPVAPDELVTQTQLADYARALIEDKPLAGAAKELNAELGMSEGSVWQGNSRVVDVPWAVEGMEDKLPKYRQFADAVTNLPTTNAPQNRQAVSPMNFKRSIMAFLGVSMPAVAMGEVEYPYLTAGPTAGAVARQAGKDAEAFTFRIEKATLKSIATGAQIEVESLKEYGEAEWENLIRNHLRSAMMDTMNDYVLKGSGASNQPTGILTRIGTAELANGDSGGADAHSAMTWSDVVKALWVHLDDPTIFSPAELRFLFGKDTLAYLHGLYRTTDSEMDALDKYAQKGASFGWSGRMPAAVAASTGVSGKQNALMMSNYGAENVVVPVWSGYRLVYDEITGAKTGIVSFWARAMMDVAYRRSAANTIAGAKELIYVMSNAE